MLFVAIAHWYYDDSARILHHVIAGSDHIGRYNEPCAIGLRLRQERKWKQLKGRPSLPPAEATAPFGELVDWLVLFSGAIWGVAA